MTPLIIIVALIVAALVAVTTVRLTTPASTSRFSADFKQLPTGVLTGGGIEFSRLPAPRLSAVRVTPAGAVRIAESQYGHRHGARVELVSLGGYIDKSQIVRDWVGTRSFVPKPVPSYFVRIYVPFVVTVDPSHNHFWNVIVNATSGRITSAFSYD